MYSHTTFATAKSLLAERLGDASKIWWTNAELGFAIVEAKRMWNALTLHDRARGKFDTTDTDAFYQLRDVLVDVDDGSTLLRSHTIRDRSILSEIEYHLVESQGLSTWAGTDQFTLNQILTALQRRRDRFLADTACVVVHRIGDIPNEIGLVEFPDSVIGLRRATFQTFGGRYYTLRTSDERYATVGNRRWFGIGKPAAYSVSAEGNLRVQLIPPPEELGTLESIVVTSGETLDTTQNGNLGMLLGIPDDYVWGIKYGALADLLRDVNSADSARAAVCDQLYGLAVQLASRMPVVLNATINGTPVLPATLAQTDLRFGGWEGRNAGTPHTLSIVAPDMIATTPVPGATSSSISLDVVRRAIVPNADGDYLEIGREHLDAILSMAQRICMFKLGGAEYESTEPLAAKFFEEAQRYSYRRSATSTSLQAMSRTSARPMSDTPWEHAPRTVEDRSDDIRSERNARRRPFRKST